MKNSSQSAPPIRPRTSSTFFFRIWGKKTFTEANLELIKNSIDWGARYISFDTTDRTKLVVIDDGRGMDEEGRNSFMSVDFSAANGLVQSGLFGTGSKMILFTFASHLAVVTAPHDDPDYVLRWEFTPEELSELLLTNGELIPERVKKTAQTWPLHSRSEFGTILTYTFREPSSKKIVRGNQLATMLTNRLDMHLTQLDINVDDEHIPQKEIVGEHYQDFENEKLGGEVVLSFYRPKQKSREEDLRLGYKFLGEVSFREKGGLFSKLPAELLAQIPEVYTNSEVCGFVKVPAFEKYADENRKDIDDGVGFDPAIIELIRLLKKEAPLVEAALKITHRRVSSLDETSMLEVHELAERSQKLYDPSGQLTGEMTSQVLPGDRSKGVKSGEQNPEPQPHADPPNDGKANDTFRITLVPSRREFEVGETIKARLVSDHDMGDNPWYVDSSRCATIDMSNTEVTLKAESVGSAAIGANEPLRARKSRVEFEIVTKRELRISPADKVMNSGERLTLHAINHDKVKGKIMWSVSGDASLSPEDPTDRKQVVLVAPTVFSTITIKVECWDSAAPSKKSTCLVTVMPDKVLPIVIKDYVFTVQFWESADHEYAKLATGIFQGAGKPHVLVINKLSPEYTKAIENDMFSNVLLNQLCLEYARMKTLDEGKDADDDVISDDPNLVVRAIRVLSSQVLAEML